MKKYSKYLIVFLISLILSASTILPVDTYQKEINSTYESIANYNELYGIEELGTKQIVFNDDSKSLQKTLKYLAVFIEFQDSDDLVTNHLDDPESVANAELLLNSDELFEMDTVSGVIEVPSFKKYYEMQSYGKLKVSTEIFPKKDGKVISYRDAHPMGYYLKYSESNPIGYKDSKESLERETELINSAVTYISQEIENSNISSTEIDTGNDGIVDAISFFIEGRNALSSPIGWGDLLWSHKLDNYGITSTILGKKVISYNLLYTYDYTESAGLFSLNRGTYGTIIHEFGHTLGLADLYRFDHSGSQPVGFYDIMGQSSGSNPQNFLTYFISEYDTSLAWHDKMPVISKTTKNITLKKPTFTDPKESRAIKLQIDNSQNEFFVVEYHAKQETYSSYSADSSGIIVYRVNDNNKYAGNKEGGDHGELDHIFVFRPEEPSLGMGKGELSQATLNMNRRTFGRPLGTVGFDNRTIYYADGTNSGIVIEVTNETEDSITFDVTFPSVEGSGTKIDPYLIGDVETFLYQLSLNTTGKHYKLTSDLDFQNVEYPSIDFKGNLDGDNHTIKNVTTKTGIFNTLGIYGTPTTVENLFAENLIVSSSTGSYLGGFASTTSNVTISNVHLLSGSVTNVESTTGNSLDSTGGFAGNVSEDTTIKNCSSSLDVSSPQNVGGFIGVNLNARIIDSFTDGQVKGKTNVGAFIGLQCIMGSTYNTPVNAYYKITDTASAVGGYPEYLHNQSALRPTELDKGITGISVPETVTIKIGELLSFVPITVPSTKISYSMTVEDENLIAISNGTLSGKVAGTSQIFTNVAIGTYEMHIFTKVLVLSEQGVLTENEVLNYLGLTNKNGYVVGFTLEDNVANVKRVLSSLEGVSLENFKDARGNDIDTGAVSTGMTFTLKFSNTEFHYIVVIKGDTTGDGLIYATDYVKIKNHIMGKSTLTGAYYLAADIDNDGKIYATDYVKIRNYIMGRGEIPQN